MDDWNYQGGPPHHQPPPRTSVSRRRRQVVAGLAGVAGLVAMAAGWVGVSGTRVISDQLAYLASGAVVGASLVGIAIGILVIDYLVELEERIRSLQQVPGPAVSWQSAPSDVAPDSGGGQHGDTQDDDTQEIGVVSASWDEDDQALIALEGASRVHRPGCQLVRGKESAFEISAEDARTQELGACRVCKPIFDESALSTVG